VGWIGFAIAERLGTVESSRSILETSFNVSHQFKRSSSKVTTIDVPFATIYNQLLKTERDNLILVGHVIPLLVRIQSRRIAGMSICVLLANPLSRLWNCW